MTPRKLKLLIFTFSYGGNGGFKSQHPEVGRFVTKVVLAAKKDPRIDDVVDHYDLADTPITMTRNRAVLLARQIGADVILMLDSDQHPDMYLGEDPEAVPFFESSFDFLYQNYERFPKGCVIGSPYCGPPVSEENVHVFRWVDFISDTPDPNFKLEAYTRTEAAIMRGIQPAGALPTGITLWDTRVFELTEPTEDNRAEWKGWFYYEWSDKYASEKASTEDVTATRDLMLAGMLAYKYNPVFCNWSAWAGHYKPKMVGKPQPLPSDYVSSRLAKAMQEGKKHNERLICLRPEEYTMNASGHAQQLADARAEVAAANAACDLKPMLANAAANGIGSCPNSDPLARCDEVEYGQVVSTETDEFKNSFGEPIVPIKCADAPPGFVRPGGHYTPEQDLNALTTLVQRLAVRFPDRPLEILEVGSFVGESALALERGFGPQGGTIYCVDTWQGSEGEKTGELARAFNLFEVFKQNIEADGTPRFNKTVVPIRGKSVEVAARMFRTFDLVFIDAAHDYDNVKADIAAWLPKVHNGGFIAGHDYTVPGMEGVDKAVEETFGNATTLIGNSIWCAQLKSSQLNLSQLEAIA